MKFKEFKEKVITWGQKYDIEITIGKYKEIIEILTDNQQKEAATFMCAEEFCFKYLTKYIFGWG